MGGVEGWTSPVQPPFALTSKQIPGGMFTISGNRMMGVEGERTARRLLPFLIEDGREDIHFTGLKHILEKKLIFGLCHNTQS